MKSWNEVNLRQKMLLTHHESILQFNYINHAPSIPVDDSNDCAASNARCVVSVCAI